MSMPPPEFQRLRTRLALSLALLSIAVSGLVFFLISYQMRGNLLEQSRLRLLDLTRLSAYQINLAAPIDPQGEISAGERGLKPALERILEAGEDLVQADILLVQDDEIILIASAGRTSEGTQGSPIQSSPQLIDQLRDLDGSFVEESFSKEAGRSNLRAYALLLKTAAGQEVVLRLTLDVSKAIAQERTSLVLLLLIFSMLVLLTAILGWLLGRRLTQSLLALLGGIDRWSKGDMTYRIQSDGSAEIQAIGRALNRMADIVHQVLVNEEERALKSEHRRSRLESTIKTVIGAASVAAPDRGPNEVEAEILKLLGEAYRLNAAGIYRLEEPGDCAVLSSWFPVQDGSLADSGQGPSILQKVQLDSGVVGQAISAALENDGAAQTEEPMRNHNSQMVEVAQEGVVSGSEAALPLQARGRVLGALWLSSPDRETFYDEKLKNIRFLADMIAVILDNHNRQVRLPAARPVQRLTGSREIEAVPTQTAEVLLSSRGPAVFRAGVSDLAGQPEEEDPSGADGQSLAVLSLPILLRGQTIGSLDLQKSTAGGEWTPDERLLVNKLVDQLSAALESARLYEETQRRAELERMAGDIIGKIRAENHPYTILSVATEELRRALKASRAQVHLHPSTAEEKPAGEQLTEVESDQLRGEK